MYRPACHPFGELTRGYPLVPSLRYQMLDQTLAENEELTRGYPLVPSLRLQKALHMYDVLVQLTRGYPLVPSLRSVVVVERARSATL